jgi:TPR repeat protein
VQQERDKAEKLARELTTDLAQVKQTLKQTERQSAAYGDLLALERARNQGLAEQLAARRDTTPDRSRYATASLLSTPDPTQAPATDKSATSQLPASNKPGMPAGDKPATVAARPTAPEALGDPELARLISRASLLLSQGNIGTARIVLERAAETGSAPALFALAETYDPTTLAAWGTFGTQGDVAKARELYAKAFASGVREAGDRLNALRE